MLKEETGEEGSGENERKTRSERETQEGSKRNAKLTYSERAVNLYD